MTKNYIITAFKVGPVAMIVFLTSLNCLTDDEMMNADEILIIFSFGCAVTTIIAFIAGVMVYGLFELLCVFNQLRLTQKATFHFFLPVLTFVFGAILGATIYLSHNDVSISVAVSAYISSTVGWSFFCISKSEKT